MTSAIRPNFTPTASQQTLYFDALSNLPMSPELTGNPELVRQSSPPPSQGLGQGQQELVSSQPQLEQPDELVIPHPNGSNGWLPAEDYHAATASSAPKNSILKRESSPPMSEDASFSDSATSRRLRRDNNATELSNGPQNGSVRGNSLKRSGSRRSLFTNSEGRQITGSMFINGAGTTGPLSVAEHDAGLEARSSTADGALTPKQKTKLAKEEARNSRHLSKIIKKEGKAEKQALSAAISELAELQKCQKAEVKREAHAQASHSKVLLSFKKAESAYLAAKKRYDTAMAQLNAEEESLEIIREGAREIATRVQEKSQEVDALQTMLRVDEKEREVKLGQLKAKAKLGSLWR